MAYDPARATKKLTEEQVRPLAERQWTNEAIASYLGVDRATLERQYASKLREWKQVGRCYLLDMAWAKIQSNKCPEKLFVEMMKRYVWKTHMDKVKIQAIKDPNANEEQKLGELYGQIQEAIHTQQAWIVTQPKEAQPAGLLSEAITHDGTLTDSTESRPPEESPSLQPLPENDL